MPTATIQTRVRVPHQFTPRPYQVPVFEAFDNGIRRFLTCWHRRAGKDKAAFNLMIREAATGRIGNYWYVFPTYALGKKALWDSVSDGMRVLDHCPRELLTKKPNESDLSLDLKNGSTIQIVGSNDPDALRGPNPVGIVFSEFAEQSPMAWQVVKPIIIENRGWVLFNFTPRGNNHAFTLYDEALGDPDWFVSLLTVDDTDALDAGQLAEARKGSSEEFFRQEYYCDFEAGNEGSYYGRLLAAAKDDGRITRVQHDPALPVHTAWDLGVGDATAIWFFQVVGRERRYVDYYEASGEGLPHYVQCLQQRGYVYGKHYAPHDIEVREFTSGTSRLKTARTLGICFEVLPQSSLEDGIEATRLLLPRCWFDAERCKPGIDALRNYHKAFDDKRQTWRTSPEHDWCFTGDTLVWTRNGTCPIMYLPTDDSGEVLTPWGWKRYQGPWVTGRNARLVAVRFDDGTTARCTPEHLFLTENGWRSAASLRMGSVILSTSTRLHSTSTANSIVAGPENGISLRAGSGSTLRYGAGLMVRYRVGAISTIGMTILSTIGWATWNVSPRRSIFPYRARKHRGTGFPMLHWTRRVSGISRMLADCGTAAWRNARKAGRSGSVRNALASIAANHSMLSYDRAATRSGSAPRFAKPLRIVSVTPLTEREDVYDITVPGANCFTLANGAVVHNSSHAADAFRYSAMANVERGKLRAPEPTQQVPSYGRGWR